MSSERSFISSRWMKKFHCIEYGERFSGFCGQPPIAAVFEKLGPGSVIDRSSASAVRAEDLLNRKGPELAQVLQLLHEGRVVEHAEAGADDGLRTSL